MQIFNFQREYTPNLIVLQPKVINERIKELLGSDGYPIIPGDPTALVLDFTVSKEDYSVRIQADESYAPMMCTLQFQSRIWMEVMDFVDWGYWTGIREQQPGERYLH